MPEPTLSLAEKIASAFRQKAAMRVLEARDETTLGCRRDFALSRAKHYATKKTIVFRLPIEYAGGV